jgi:predicted aspartyl protease
MTAPFNPAQGPIPIEAEISGPTARSNPRLLIDTAATMTLIDPSRLIAIGYNPAASPHRAQVATGGGVVTVPRVVLNRMTVLGTHRIGFPVLSHALPPGSGVDGLLGLDFLRGQVLTLDFRAGLITLS